MSNEKTPEDTRARFCEKLGERCGSLYFHIKNAYLGILVDQRFYKNLFQSKHSVDLLNESASFFWHKIQFIMVDSLILRVGILMDPALSGRGTTNANASIAQLLKLNGISEEKIFSQRLSDCESASETLKVHRNKRVAHADLEVSLGGAELDQLTLENLEVVVEKIGDILFLFERNNFSNTACFDLIAPLSDEFALLKRLYYGNQCFKQVVSEVKDFHLYDHGYIDVRIKRCMEGNNSECSRMFSRDQERINRLENVL